MFFKIKVVVFLLLMANFACATLVDVTKTSILVKDTNANDSLKLKQALAQILVINTGEPIFKILQNPHFQESQVKKGIKRTYFEKVESEYLTNKDAKYYWFHVVVHEKYLNNLIKQAGFSLLPHNRQDIVLWAAKEQDEIPVNLNDLVENKNLLKPINKEEINNNEPILEYAYDDEVLNYWFKHWAKAMGLVFIRPDIDEEDMLIVTPDSIQSLSFQAHEQTKLKYFKNLSLLLFLKRSEQGSKFRTGTFIEDNEMTIKHIQQEGVEEGELLYSVMADVAEKYANFYKIDSYDLEAHAVQLVINGLNSFDDVDKAKKYISNLSVIESFQIVSASKGRIIISADLSIATESFLQIIERQNILHHNINGSINQLMFYLISNIEE